MYDEETIKREIQNTRKEYTMAETNDSERDNPIKISMGENQALVDSARNKNTGHWLQRMLLPDSIVQQSSAAEKKELAVGFEYRRKVLQLAVDSKLQAVEETCNHVLVTGKSEIRRERQEFFADQVSKLAMSMHNYAEEFNTEVDRRLDGIELKYKNEIIRSKERARLVRQIEDFHNVLEEMATEFQQIINEGVKADKNPARVKRI